MNPRKPTEEEKNQLIQYMTLKISRNPTDADEEDQRSFVENAAIAVFDRYTTDSPGYSGRVMVVVWGAGPEITETFVWRNGQLENEPIQS